MRIVVGICGASGVALGLRMVAWLRERAEHKTHAIVTRAAWRIMEVEIGARPDLGVPVYGDDDFGSALASSSFRGAAMAILPCSMRTLAGPEQRHWTAHTAGSRDSSAQ